MGLLTRTWPEPPCAARSYIAARAFVDAEELILKVKRQGFSGSGVLNMELKPSMISFRRSSLYAPNLVAASIAGAVFFNSLIAT